MEILLVFFSCFGIVAAIVISLGICAALGYYVAEQKGRSAWEKRVKDIGEKHGFDLRIEQAPEEPSNGRESEDAATIRTDPHQ